MRQVHLDYFPCPFVREGYDDRCEKGQACDNGTETRLAIDMGCDALARQILVHDDLIGGPVKQQLFDQPIRYSLQHGWQGTQAHGWIDAPLAIVVSVSEVLDSPCQFGGPDPGINERKEIVLVVRRDVIRKQLHTWRERRTGCCVQGRIWPFHVLQTHALECRTSATRRSCSQGQLSGRLIRDTCTMQSEFGSSSPFPS